MIKLTFESVFNNSSKPKLFFYNHEMLEIDESCLNRHFF